MASLRGTFFFPKTSLTAGTTYNLFCLAAPAHQRVVVEGIWVYGDYNTAGTCGPVYTCRASSQGSIGVSGSALTAYPVDEDDTETFQTTCYSLPGTAPSSIVPFGGRMVNPQLGVDQYWIPAHQRIIKGGGFFVVQFVPGSAANYLAELQFVE